MNRIYLDHNATTPLAPEVIAALEPYLRAGFGNPSSLHWAGIPARDAVERARCQVAGLLRCDATEIIFTSGGTEGNNHALKGVFFASSSRKDTPHFIISSVEHPSISEPCRFLQRLGAAVTHIPVDRHGQVEPESVQRSLRPNTVLVSVMHANNEVGTIQPIEEIAAIVHKHGALLHSDAAQTVGKILVDIESLGVDLLTIAGHKLYAPKGVGALFVREGVELEPLLHGAGHEAGRRAGTENVLEIVGLGAACEAAVRWLDNPAVQRLRDYFWTLLQKQFGSNVVLNGHPTARLPNTLNVSFPGRLGFELLSQLGGVAASTGSACHAGSTQISPVLAAMGVSHDVGLGAVRFSLGRDTTRSEIDAVVAMLTEEAKAC